MKQVIKDQRSILKAINSIRFYLATIDIDDKDYDALADVHECINLAEERAKYYFETYS